jgi:hypothetical protein
MVNHGINNPAHAQSFEERLEAQFHYMDTHKVDHSNVETVLTRPEYLYEKETIFHSSSRRDSLLDRENVCKCDIDY